MAEMITYTGYVVHDTESGQLKIDVLIPELVSNEEKIYPAIKGPPPPPPEIPPGFEDVDYVPVANEQTFEAFWKPEGKLTVAPKMMQGEKVKILTYDGVDKFEWTTDGYDKELTRVQSHVTAVTGMPKAEPLYGKHFDSDSSYYTRVDSENKVVEVKTSMLNEEIGTFHIKIDTATGFVTYDDSFGNFVHLNAPEGKLDVKMKEINITADKMTFNLTDFIVNALKTKWTKGVLIIAAISTFKKKVDFEGNTTHKAPSKFEVVTTFKGTTNTEGLASFKVLGSKIITATTITAATYN